MPKHLQLKYSLLHIFFWLSYCCVYGYIAVFLRYRGMSNTMIGLTSGINCAMTIVTTPFFTGLVGKTKGLTIKKMIVISYSLMIALWAAMIWLPFPQAVLMLLFIALGNLMGVNVPLLTTICMNYLTDGLSVNFGLARGLGSVSYATTAVVLGLLIERIDPTVLAFMHAGSTVLLFLTLFSMPDAEAKATGAGQEQLSMPAFVKHYKVYMITLFAFTLSFAAATSLGTYLINIVESLGGTTSMYGIGVFCMAASELPFMALVPVLKRRIPTMHILLFASLAYVARNIIICMAPSPGVLFFGMALQGLSYGIFTASITYYVHEALALEHGMQGQTMIAVMTTGLGSTIGNLAGGMIQDTLGLPAMLRFCEVLTIAGALLFTILAITQRKGTTKRKA
ncbi:MAG: MFS transporter [Lachnospiraceae bacterium]|nr:MFS transporter [Lachnospiraceae bacterium]